MKIKINHISKTEGSSGFEGALLNGNISRARVEVQEGARLIEGLLLGRHYSQVPIITARICGICPVIHNLTSIKALERALDIKVSHEVVILRKIMLLAQIIYSHTLHLFFMSLPDFVNVKGDLGLLKKKSKQVNWALDIRKFAVELIRVIGGRAVHPINSEVGGFKRPVNLAELEKIMADYSQIFGEAVKLAQFFAGLKYPKFERKTIFASLCSPREYAIYDGDIKTSQGKKFTPDEFIDKIQEIEREAVKRGMYQAQTYMVGALARVSNNYSNLNPPVKRIWRSLKINMLTYNTFYNVMAQAVEVVHCMEEIEKNTRIFMRMDANEQTNKGENPRSKLNLRPGEGLAAAEAPRGTLFHYYKLDENGIIKEANIITPTAQFLNNLEADLKILIPQTKHLKQEKREARLKMLIRAYDPCFTCASH